MLGEFAKYAFFGLTRKDPAFERSVLKYVSIKNRILTPSGQKSRVCVNAADRLLPATNFFSSSAFPCCPNKALNMCGMAGIFAFWQGKTVFYAGSVLFWYSTGIKKRFDAAKNKKIPMPRMFSGQSPSHAPAPSQPQAAQTKPRPPA